MDHQYLRTSNNVPLRISMVLVLMVYLVVVPHSYGRQPQLSVMRPSQRFFSNNRLPVHYDVTTLAGAQYNVDGSGPNARFNLPSGVSMSIDGKYAFIADTVDRTIRELELATGTVTTIAGALDLKGSDNGVGGAARFTRPTGITISHDGTFLLIADAGNHTIRKIDLSTHLVTTIAGVADSAGLSDGIGSAARFHGPFGIALTADDSIALITDSDNHSIRKLVLATGSVSTIAGSAGVAGWSDSTWTNTMCTGGRLDGPGGITITPDGTRAYIADTNNHTIRVLDLLTQCLSTLAGSAGTPGSADGSGLHALFSSPRGIALVPNTRRLLIADTANQTLRGLDLDTHVVSTIAGMRLSPGHVDGIGTAALLNAPIGIALNPNGQSAVITEEGNGVIRHLAISTGQVSTLAGHPPVGTDDGIGLMASFNEPRGVALTQNGSIALVADAQNHTIRKISVATGAVTTLAGTPGSAGIVDGIINARFRHPHGISLSADGSVAVVADTYNHTIRKVDVMTGEVTTLAGKPGVSGVMDGTGDNARFNLPNGIALSFDGTLAVIADTGNHRVRLLNLTNNTVSTLAGGDTYGFADGIGNQALFNGPTGIILSPDKKSAIVTDTYNYILRRVDLLTGLVSTIAGMSSVYGYSDGVGAAARFTEPVGIAIASDGRTAFITDNRMIRAFDLENQTVRTFAGTYLSAGSRDGDPTSALFNIPYGIAVDSDSHHIVVVDAANHNLRLIALRSTPLFLPFING